VPEARAAELNPLAVFSKKGIYIPMVAFEVKKNGGKIALAGREDLSVLTVIVDAVGKLGAKSAGAVRQRESAELSLSITGLTSKVENEHDEHIDWAPRITLETGDEISIRILDTNVTDRPRNLKRAYGPSGDPEREMFDNCRRVYFQLREKYESENG
jgi:hypothetical protein